MKESFVGFYSIRAIKEIDKEKSVLMFGVPFERVKDTPGGSKKAPDAIRKHSYEFSGISSDFDITKSSKSYYDLGNIHPIKEKQKLDKIWKKSEELGAKLLVLGGDHSITFDTLSNSPINDQAAIIWLDAHADLADEYPKGFFQSHGTVFTNLIHEKNLKREQMLLLGGHAFTQTSAEYDKLKDNSVEFLSTQDLFNRKEESLDYIRNYISRFEKIYLSIDVDVLDQAFVPTMGTAEPFGFTPQLLLDVISLILPKAVYVDIVEVQHTKKNKIVLNFVVGLIFQILQRWNTR